MSRYESAREIYESLGVDTEKAIETLRSTAVSVHCWQGDDVTGFDSKQALSGGIQTTGNYPGKARTPEELMQDFDFAASLMPGKKKLNLHASYAIFENGDFADRDKIEPRHFEKWVKFAKERDMGIDFNPTFFSHPMVKDNLTLSSPDEEVRRFWIEHGKRFKDSLDEILSVPYDKSKVFVCLESKVFGIGLESYTVGSAEFCMNYVASKGITPLMDNGHYHPTEVVSDKISSMLLFNDRIALHITRGVRWDSDHVVILDDETKEIAKEIVRNDALGRVFIATDYFDASINRISAWVTGIRSVHKALLLALLEPNEKMKKLQDESRFTELMVLQEDMKTAPFGDIWDEYLRRENISNDYISAILDYEKNTLEARK